MATETTTQGPVAIPTSASDQSETEVQGHEPEEEVEEEEEVELEGEELFMTLSQEERDLWLKNIHEMESALKSGKERSDQWRDNFNRRRMFAISRARKLREGYRQKGAFYADLTVYLASLQGGGSSKDPRRTSKSRVSETKDQDGDRSPSSENTAASASSAATTEGQQHQQQQEEQQTEQQQQQTPS